MALRYTNTLRSAQQNAITTAAGASCEIRLYSGTIPTNADTAIGAQVLLATLTGNATFAPAAVNGVLTLNAITSGTGTAGAGAGTTCTWFRMTTAGGATVIMDGTVAISGGDLNLNNTNIATGQTVGISSYVITNNNV
jgi:hypothetical protein